MNKEQLSDAIGRVEDPLVVKTVPRRRKRRWWIGAVAAAACIAANSWTSCLRAPSSFHVRSAFTMARR